MYSDVPEIYHFDSKNNLIILEDLVGAATLDELLRSGAISATLSGAIGLALGEFIGSMHEWSKDNPHNIHGVFEPFVEGKELTVNLNYAGVMNLLKVTNGDVPPALLDPPIDISENDAHSISKTMDDLRRDWMTSGAEDVVSFYPPFSVVSQD